MTLTENQGFSLLSVCLSRPWHACVTCNKARVLGNLYMGTFVFVICLLLTFQSVSSLNFKENTKSYSPCEKCTIVVQSFTEGLKRTSRGKHEGGDAHWEENRLYNYADSEIRLTEIQEKLCHEVSSGKDQCHSFAEEFESELEDWFFQKLNKERSEQKEEGSSLLNHLCNQVAKACCPEGHFGANCEPCAGYPHEVCNGNGYCAGNGTREGKGGCICFQGFSGEKCGQCDTNYYPSGTIEKSVDQQVVQLPEKCEKCDRSCASTCHASGPTGCNVCRKGFSWDEESGCVDTNECALLETNPCKEATYCANTEGSYKCLPCHNSCSGCIGSGESSCLECAEGFTMQNGNCIDKNQLEKLPWARYLTYFCLIATTLVIMRTSTAIGWILVLLTTLYITVYEFELKYDS